MLLPPGSDLRAALKHSAEPIELVGGGRYPGCYVAGLQHPVVVRGNGACVDWLKTEDCPSVDLQNLTCEDAPKEHSAAFHFVGIASLTLRRVKALRPHVNGFLTSDVMRALLDECEGRDSETGHGLYLSQHGADYAVRGGAFTGSKLRCGIQANAHPGHARGLLIEGADCTGNANVGIQLAGITDGILRHNRVDGGRYGVVAWCDQGGNAYGCRNIDLTEQPGTVQVCQHSRNVKTAPGAHVERLRH